MAVMNLDASKWGSGSSHALLHACNNAWLLVPKLRRPVGVSIGVCVRIPVHVRIRVHVSIHVRVHICIRIHVHVGVHGTRRRSIRRGGVRRTRISRHRRRIPVHHIRVRRVRVVASSATTPENGYGEYVSILKIPSAAN